MTKLTVPNKYTDTTEITANHVCFSLEDNYFADNTMIFHFQAVNMEWFHTPSIIQNRQINSKLDMSLKHWKRFPYTQQQYKQWNLKHFNNQQQQFMVLGLCFHSKALNIKQTHLIQNIYIKAKDLINKKLKKSYFKHTIDTLRHLNFSVREVVIRPNSKAVSTDFATIDITMCCAAFKCQKLEDMIQNLSMIHNLKVCT